MALHIFIYLFFHQSQVFDANSGPSDVSNITLDNTGILTRFVRIYPLNCTEIINESQIQSPSVFCILRFEIFGCLGF